MPVYLLGTLNTKGREGAYVAGSGKGAAAVLTRERGTGWRVTENRSTVDFRGTSHSLASSAAPA